MASVLENIELIAALGIVFSSATVLERHLHGEISGETAKKVIK